jgi:hypothetical protein
MKNEDYNFEEWQTTREQIQNFDNLIHDIRKYGFTFITALLATQALLIPYLPQQSPNIPQTLIVFPDIIKAAILGITLLLILAVAFFEKSYQQYQVLTAQRSIILELKLNLNLTKTLSYQFNNSTIKSCEFLVYLIYVLATFALAIFIINQKYIAIIIGLLFISIVVLLIIFNMKHANHPNWPNVDWSVNKLECKKGEKIEITATNLGMNPIKLYHGDPVWEIRKQDRSVRPYTEKIKIDLELNQFDSYTWFWDTKKFVGVYQIFPLFPKSCRCKNNPLKKIICYLINWNFDHCIPKHNTQQTKNEKKSENKIKNWILSKILTKRDIGEYHLSRTIKVYEENSPVNKYYKSLSYGKKGSIKKRFGNNTNE